MLMQHIIAKQAIKFHDNKEYFIKFLILETKNNKLIYGFSE